MSNNIHLLIPKGKVIKEQSELSDIAMTIGDLILMAKESNHPLKSQVLIEASDAITKLIGSEAK